MARDYIKWDRLDNTANLFPVIAGESLTNTYRISCTLKTEIDPQLLQEAVDIVTPKVPGFDLRLRTGVFWYYFEENGKPAPRVVQEDTYPCRFIHESKNNSYLFRVTYYKCRINLEVFHVLTDGMGGMLFLREIVYQYLRLKEKALKDIPNELSTETSLNREDSFIKNYRNAAKNTYQKKKAFLIKGERLPYDGFGVIIGYMPIPKLKEMAKSYGCSINEYLVACFIWATFKLNMRSVSKEHPIRVAVPVNLRPYFDSVTTKNFFVMVSAEFAPEAKDYDFAEIAHITHDSLKAQINKENLEKLFSYNVSNEQIFAARLVPLPLKNLAMKLVYTQSALANTTTITNIGNISVEEPYEPYIEGFNAYLALSKGQELKGTVSSYKDKLSIAFTSNWAESEIQKEFFRQISRDGIDVEIETNGVY